MLYCLNADLQVERVIEGSPLTTELENTVTSVKEPGTRELIQKAIELHRSYTPDNIRFATEKSGTLMSGSKRTILHWINVRQQIKSFLICLPANLLLSICLQRNSKH